MKQVIVFGSMNMDLSICCDVLPAKGETTFGNGFIQTPGGKGANQAVAAARMGVDTHMLGKVGQDFFGSTLRQSLLDAGVQCQYLQEDGSHSGVAMIIRSQGDNRIICDYGANYESKAQDLFPMMESLARPGDIFLTQLECHPEVTYAMLNRAKELGMTTILNPAPARVLPESLYAALDYIIVNQTECEILTGCYPPDENSCAAPLSELHRRGVAVPLITLGERGSVLLANGTIRFQPSFSVPDVDTTAAGDAFIGVFSSALAREEPLDQAILLATKAAAITITRLGAQQAIPCLEEVNQFITKEGGICYEENTPDN